MGASRYQKFEDLLRWMRKKEERMKTKRSYEKIFEKEEEEEEDYCNSDLKLQEWESDDDEFFESDCYDECISEVANFNAPDYTTDDEFLQDARKFLDHYFYVCKCRGFEFYTRPPPERWSWTETFWVKPFPMDEGENRLMIEQLLTEQAFPIIKNITGEELSLLDIIEVNVFGQYLSLSYYITFEAQPKSSSFKGVYRTRLVPYNPLPRRSSSWRVFERVGYHYDIVHSFRLIEFGGACGVSSGLLKDVSHLRSCNPEPDEALC